jgi:hypothetical protein
MANVVETILKLQGARAFVKDADSASHSLTGIGDSAEKSGEKAKRGWKGIAKWAGGTAAVYGASRYLHSAVDSTEELAKNTMALTRATGMDTKTSSAWAELLKVRGIDTGKFQIGMLKLSKTMEAARGGNQKAGACIHRVRQVRLGAVADVARRVVRARGTNRHGGQIRRHDQGHRRR